MTLLSARAVKLAWSFYAGGETLHQVAARFGVTAQCVHGRFRALGLQCRPAGKRRRTVVSDADRARIVELSSQGMRVLDIAKEVGWRPRTVSAVRSQEGVPPWRVVRKTNSQGLVMRRWCPRCGQMRGYREFQSNASTKDGLQSWCRKHHNEARRDRRRRRASA